MPANPATQPKDKADASAPEIEGKEPVRTTCTKCGKEGMTKPAKAKSLVQMISAAGLCVVCCCCVPFCVPTCYNYKHHCQSCQHVLAVTGKFAMLDQLKDVAEEVAKEADKEESSKPASKGLEGNNNAAAI